MATPQGPHGTLIEVELDPIGSPGVYTTIGKVQDISYPEISRAQTLAVGQEDTISNFVSTKLLMVAAIDFTAWYDPAETTHNIAAGLYKLIVDNTSAKFKIVGPVDPSDVMIFTAHVSTVGRSAPVEEGVYSITFSLQPTGEITIDGVTIS